MRHTKTILGLAVTAAAGAIALAAIAGPAFAGGPNLVTNGNFATNVNGWTGNPLVGITWSAGHGEVSLAEDNPGSTGGFVEQCLGLAIPGHMYEFGGDVYIPAGQPRGGLGSVVITFYTGANCKGGYASQTASGQVTATAVWTATKNTKTAPPNAASVAVWLNPSKKDIKYGGKSSDVFTAWYDNVVVTDQGQDPKAPTPTPPPLGSPIPVPTKQPTQPPAPTSTPFIPVITIPDGAVWPPLPASTPANTPPPKPTSAPPPDTHAPQTKDDGRATPATTAATGSESHTGTTSVPAAATPLPPTTGTGSSSESRSHLPELAGLACIAVGLASFGAARRKR